jgi:eukaryotic-like serine/threonine-protein kinase
MGEVFQAKDQVLGRDVAIKVLPEEFARDADRIARFQREAKLLASLNHPNIAAIHGLEESGGTNFLVLELVEGQTLADRIRAGPIPVEEALKLTLQIAEALEAAHDKGIIHRDLKPANIKVTPEGKAKVLDFGLAKAFAGEQEQFNLSNSPTLSDAATQQGIILGTAAYMAPEQAKGKTVDKRADIWAFGVVLFEMLTGQQLFSGETVSEILAAVLMKGPDFSSLPQNLHPKIVEALERCLEKEPRNRYGSISDARVDIQKALADPGGVFVQPKAVAERKSKWKLVPWIAAAIVFGALITGVAVWKLKPAEPRQVMRFDYNLPESQQFSDLGYKAIAVSPDGRQFVYSTSKGLYLRSVDELTAKLIAGTEGNTQTPFFSPDGKWIGYFSVTNQKLRKIAVNGSTPMDLCDVWQLRGASWNEDNTIAYGQFAHDIMRVSANPGTPESIVKLKSGNLGNPQILPDGKSILYTSDPGRGPQRIMVQSLKSGETKELFSGSDARYLPTGHIIFMLPKNSNLFAILFDPYQLKATGDPVSVVEGVRQYAISDSGILAYIPGTSGGAAPGRTLVWVNRDGKEEPLSAPPKEYWVSSISPDGKRVALHVISPKHDIWIWDLVRETMMPLTLDEGAGSVNPLWTLDGKRIVYTSSRENVWFGDLYWRAADGTGKAEMLASSPDRGLFPSSWSKDGKTLALWEITRSPLQSDIGLLSMEGDHARKPLLHEKYNEASPRISPDGRWMAYASDETGSYEVYVCPFSDVTGGKWQVSANGGGSPLWSRNSREVYYLSGDAAWAVPVETEPTFKPGRPRVLFHGTFARRTGEVTTDSTLWNIGPDGRFLMMKEAVAEAPRKINIVLNWFEELKQRVPAK